MSYQHHSNSINPILDGEFYILSMYLKFVVVWRQTFRLFCMNMSNTHKTFWPSLYARPAPQVPLQEELLPQKRRRIQTEVPPDMSCTEDLDEADEEDNDEKDIEFSDSDDEFVDSDYDLDGDDQVYGSAMDE